MPAMYASSILSALASALRGTTASLNAPSNGSGDGSTLLRLPLTLLSDDLPTLLDKSAAVLKRALAYGPLGRDPLLLQPSLLRHPFVVGAFALSCELPLPDLLQFFNCLLYWNIRPFFIILLTFLLFFFILGSSRFTTCIFGC